MAILPIADFLKRFVTLKKPNAFAREKSAEIFSLILREEIPISNIKIQGTTVFVNVPSVQKSELLLHEAEIKSFLSEQKISVTDIR